MDGDTESRKYKKKRPRENRDYRSYIFRHRTTSITSNTLWGNSGSANGDSCNSNEHDNK